MPAMEYPDYESVDAVLAEDRVPVVTLGGFGLGYDNSCLKLFLNTLKHFEDNNIDPQDLEEREVTSLMHTVVDKCGFGDTPSRAMVGTAFGNASFVHNNGWQAWLKEADDDRVETWEPSL